MRLFNPDAYIIVTTNEERLDLSAISEKTKRRLNLSFNCFLTKDSEPNDGECTIYNLSETSRNKISEGDKVELFAGYDGNYKLISIGDIFNVQNRNPGTEWQTRRSFAARWRLRCVWLFPATSCTHHHTHRRTFTVQSCTPPRATPAA